MAICRKAMFSIVRLHTHMSRRSRAWAFTEGYDTLYIQLEICSEDPSPSKSIQDIILHYAEFYMNWLRFVNFTIAIKIILSANTARSCHLLSFKHTNGVNVWTISICIKPSIAHSPSLLPLRWSVVSMLASFVSSSHTSIKVNDRHPPWS